MTPAHRYQGKPRKDEGDKVQCSASHLWQWPIASRNGAGVRMPCLAPWRCREVSPSQHRLLEHRQSQEKTPPRQLLRPSG
jgi:hypothetical protein